MRPVALFLILNIQCCHVLATFPDPLWSPAQTNHELKGYECGDIFFTDFEVNKALALARTYLDKGLNYPQRYQGKLYTESNFKEYLQYPISKNSQILPATKNPWANFRVIFTRGSKEAVGVIAKTTTNDYTKCIRRDSSHIGPSHSEQENTNGYLCGHEFFDDEIILQSLAIALNRDGERTKFPCPYTGKLFPKDGGFLMWPIIRGKKLFKTGTVHGTYFLILTKEGIFVDVVIRGYSNNFLRCTRSRQAPKAPESDPHSKLFVPPPKPGFVCGKTFFDYKALEDAAKIVKKKVGKGKKGKFPENFSGHPYNEDCFIWPIMKDGKLYRKGNKGMFRFILTPDYNVMSVAVIVGDELKACERKTIKATKNHDLSGYQCIKQRFSHQQLLIASERACERMNAGTKHFYPARYEGPKFYLDGPYFTYPLDPNFVTKQRNIGLDRVVINRNCEVVGALTTIETITNGDLNHGFQKKLVKCHRLADGQLPIGFFGDNAVAVNEYKIDF
ncbi:hypothetical protein EPUL_003302 [Erysiphe pulchra]|uniref:Uncharacterized protein n=1 Tax=Erysiphe pulchra TaxID=225359 RepID=A0A2S4PLW0_9PEZI|nr:hypothetical protein EPUL_003302 [Erysiphe pulchra]